MPVTAPSAPQPEIDWPGLTHEPRRERYGVLQPIGNYPVLPAD